jgi:predicted N-formylglutamate amidohydrolase
MKPRCLLTCEHASNAVPSEYRSLFRGQRDVLSTHRGYDIGARDLAAVFEQTLHTPVHLGEVSRLLVELNRSIGHPQLFSEFTRGLGDVEQAKILDRFYHPYRRAIQSKIAASVRRQQRVIHLSLHTFTPSLNGEVRSADVGLLYDPRRSQEQKLCAEWQRRIRSAAPQLRVRRNYPYLGKSDGFTTSLRRAFPASLYVGIELEMNQKWVEAGGLWRQLSQRLSSTFADLVRLFA